MINNRDRKKNKMDPLMQKKIDKVIIECLLIGFVQRSLLWAILLHCSAALSTTVAAPRRTFSLIIIFLR